MQRGLKPQKEPYYQASSTSRAMRHIARQHHPWIIGGSSVGQILYTFGKTFYLILCGIFLERVSSMSWTISYHRATRRNYPTEKSTKGPTPSASTRGKLLVNHRNPIKPIIWGLTANFKQMSRSTGLLNIISL